MRSRFRVPRARVGINSTYSAEEDLSDPEEGRDDTGKDGHLDGPFFLHTLPVEQWTNAL